MAQNENEQKDESKKRPWIWLLLLLLLLFIVSCFCVYQTDILGRLGLDFPLGGGNQEHQSLSEGNLAAGENQDPSEAENPVDELENQNDNSAQAEELDYQVVELDPRDYFFLPEWQASVEVESEFQSAGVLANGDLMVTFATDQDKLPPGTYVATVGSDSGKSATFTCEVIASLESYVLCYGPRFGTGTALTADLYYTPPDFTLNGKIKDSLLDGVVNLDVPNYDDYTDVAKTLGILGRIDNPFEAWTVIGCCVQAADEDGYPSGCENLVVYNEDQSIAFFDQEGRQGDPAEEWQSMMDEYNAPQEWSGEGDLMNAQAVLESANACATDLGGGEITSIGEAREFFNMVSSLDTRKDNDRSWGAQFADSFYDFFDTYFRWLTDPDYWSNIASDLSNFNPLQYLGEILTDAGKDLACGGMAMAGVFTDVDLPDWCYDDNGELDASAYDPSDENYVEPNPEDLFEPLPDSCLDYIDYSVENTYFPYSYQNQSPFDRPAEYCIDALGLEPNDFREMENTGGYGGMYYYLSRDMIYDTIIESFGYAGNPAIPDPCKMVVDWCNSDQIEATEALGGRAVVEGSYESGFWGINGCNDPANFAEAQDWTDHSDAPVCPSEDVLLDLAELFDPLPGSNPILNSYCYEAAVFEGSPIYKVQQCASDLDWNQDLLSVGDYFDFMMYLAGLQPLINFSIADISAACEETMGWVDYFGFSQQAMNAGAGVCAAGGPTKFNSSPIQWVQPKINSPLPGNNNRDDGGGSDNSCAPQTCGPGYYWDPYLCMCWAN